MKIAKLNYDGSVHNVEISNLSVGSASQACLFFAGFGQSAQAFNFLLACYRSLKHRSGFKPLDANHNLNLDFPSLINSFLSYTDPDSALASFNQQATTRTLESKEDLYMFYAYDGTEQVDFLSNFFRGYTKLRIVAWSYGVRAACSFLSSLSSNNMQATSLYKLVDFTVIAGTPLAIDLKYGIAPRFHKATLRFLNAQNYELFCLKALAQKEEQIEQLTQILKKQTDSLLTRFCTLCQSERSLDSLKQELEVLATLPIDHFFTLSPNIKDIDFQYPIEQAYLTQQDLIFTYDSQVQYFNDYQQQGMVCQVVSTPCAHLDCSLLDYCLFRV